MHRFVFISFLFAIMSFLIYFVKIRSAFPDILEDQRQELLNLADLVNGIQNSIDIEGDNN